LSDRKSDPSLKKIGKKAIERSKKTIALLKKAKKSDGQKSD